MSQMELIPYEIVADAVGRMPIPFGEIKARVEADWGTISKTRAAADRRLYSILWPLLGAGVVVRDGPAHRYLYRRDFTKPIPARPKHLGNQPKLSMRVARRIRKLRDAGVPQWQIATQVGISVQLVRNVCNHRPPYDAE
jgi:hypothetical protein